MYTPRPICCCAQPAPQEERPAFAYTAEYKPIAGSSSYMSPMIFTEDGFYAVSSEKVGTEVPEGAEFRYVRLTDTGNNGNYSSWPGADIDAVSGLNAKAVMSDWFKDEKEDLPPHHPRDPRR